MWAAEMDGDPLTWDQGREMAEHVRFTVDTDVRISFWPPRGGRSTDMAKMHAAVSLIL